jgi:hypothetical protein
MRTFICEVIAGQRDSLTARRRSRAGKARAEADKLAGIKPGLCGGRSEEFLEMKK